MTSARPFYLLFLLIVMAFSGCDTKNDFEDTFKNYFIKYYGEDGKQAAVDMVVNTDGTMLLLGTTTLPNDELKILLIKVNAEGNILWQKQLGEIGEDEVAKDIEPTLDGDFIILSNIFLTKNPVTGSDEHDIHLIKISPEGEIRTGESFRAHFFKSQFGNSVTPISDNYITNGGYIVTGYTTEVKSDIPPPDNGVQLTNIITFLFKKVTDGVADTVWTSRITNPLVGEGIKVFESETYDSINYVTNLPYEDRPFYLFGFSDDNNGTAVQQELNFGKWTLTESGVLGAGGYDTFAGDATLPEVMSSSIKVNGNGFVSVGTQTQVSGGKKNVFLATSQARSSGLRYNSPPVTFLDIQDLNIEAVAVTPSVAGGRYLILCNETSLSGTTNIWLSKVDTSGKVYWSASFGAISQNDFAATVHELPNGQILVLGTIELETQNNKIVLMKLNSNGEFLN